MEILFYRYGSICEPGIIHSFERLGLTVLTKQAQTNGNSPSLEESLHQLAKILDSHHPLFVFSVNYFPLLSSICQIYQIPYVSWTVDVPLLELFSPTLQNTCNRVFLFDRAQYEYFHKRSPQTCFYLPLATDVASWDSMIQGASAGSLEKFSGNITFIGSLYSEKDPYCLIQGAPETAKGFVEGLMTAQQKIYGYNFLEDCLPPEVIDAYNKIVPDMHREDLPVDPAYVLAHVFLGYHVAALERRELLNSLAMHFSVNLYTQSDSSALRGVHVKGSANSQTEMPLIFHQSRINLNATIKPIQTGLPQRIFDICGCGGFLLTNFQSELPEYYEPRKEVAVFSSAEELLDLCNYYLTHEEERSRLAAAGYQRTRREHTYDIRIAKMIQIVHSTL